MSYNVYLRFNKVTSKAYAGSTNKDIHARERQDHYDAKTPSRARYHSSVCQAYRDHGLDSFKTFVVATAPDKESAEVAEQMIIDKLHLLDASCGYNQNRAISEKRMAELMAKIDMSKVQFRIPL